MENKNKTNILFDWLFIATTFHECGLITKYIVGEIYGFAFVGCEGGYSKEILGDMDKAELSKHKEIFSYDVKIADVFTKRGLRIVRKNGIKYRKAIGCIGLITMWDLCEFLESFYENPELNTKYLWRGTRKISPFESGEIEWNEECDEFVYL